MQPVNISASSTKEENFENTSENSVSQVNEVCHERAPENKTTTERTKSVFFEEEILDEESSDQQQPSVADTAEQTRLNKDACLEGSELSEVSSNPTKEDNLQAISESQKKSAIHSNARKYCRYLKKSNDPINFGLKHDLSGDLTLAIAQYSIGLDCMYNAILVAPRKLLTRKASLSKTDADCSEDLSCRDIKQNDDDADNGATTTSENEDTNVSNTRSYSNKKSDFSTDDEEGVSEYDDSKESVSAESSETSSTTTQLVDRLTELINVYSEIEDRVAYLMSLPNSDDDNGVLAPIEKVKQPISTHVKSLAQNSGGASEQNKNGDASDTSNTEIAECEFVYNYKDYLPYKPSKVLLGGTALLAATGATGLCLLGPVGVVAGAVGLGVVAGANTAFTRKKARAGTLGKNSNVGGA